MKDDGGMRRRCVARPARREGAAEPGSVWDFSHPSDAGGLEERQQRITGCCQRLGLQGDDAAGGGCPGGVAELGAQRTA